jgi:hypothetical protein
MADIPLRSDGAQNARRQRGDFAAGLNRVDLQIEPDAICRKLADTIQDYGSASHVSSDVLQGRIYPRAQGIVQYLNGVLQGLIHSVAQEIVQDLKSRELPGQTSTEPPEAPLSDE